MRIRAYIFAAAALLWATQAHAAARFWNPYSVTGAVSGTGGVCRLTISPAIVGSGLTTSSIVTVTGITGVTGCNVSQNAVSAIVDSTHIELTGTTFGGSGFGGTACLAGGEWTSSNTSNWAASSTTTCGSGGSSVPVAADSVTIDANSTISTCSSNCGTIHLNQNISITNLTWGANNGTLDWSVNNNTLTVSGTFSGSGSGTRTWKNSTGAITLTANTAPWTMQTTTGLTLSPTASTFTSPIVFNTSSGALRTFHTGGLTYSNVTVSDSVVFNKVQILDSGSTITSLTMTGPAALITSAAFTITNAFTWTATSSNPILFGASSYGTAITVTLGAAGSTGSWVYLNDITFATNSATFNNSFNLGDNTNATVNPPSFGAGGRIIGG